MKNSLVADRVNLPSEDEEQAQREHVVTPEHVKSPEIQRENDEFPEHVESPAREKEKFDMSTVSVTEPTLMRELDLDLDLRTTKSRVYKKITLP